MRHLGADDSNAEPVLAVLARGWGWLWPLASVAGLVLFALAPRGEPHDPLTPAALLPLLALHYWTVRAGAAAPFILAFSAGLASDVVSHGPVGLWALVDVAAVALSAWLAPLARRGLLAHLAVAVVMLAAAGLALSLTVAAAALEAPRLAPAFMACAGAAFLYPALAAVLFAATPPASGSMRPGKLPAGGWP